MQYSLPLQTGCFYHIYNRGNHSDIFFEDKNYHYFLKLYGDYIYPIAETYAYCLLKNHFHFLIRIRETPIIQTCEVSKTSQVSVADVANIKPPSQHFANFFNSYTKSINKAYNHTGSLFEKRFGRVLVDNNAYFVHLVSYIHRNPQRHGFVSDFRSYPYSSYRAILEQRSSRVETEKVLAWFGNVAIFEQYHRQFDDSRIVHLLGDEQF
jgi:REP element-mobilizing transposase RayT